MYRLNYDFIFLDDSGNIISKITNDSTKHEDS